MSAQQAEEIEIWVESVMHFFAMFVFVGIVHPEPGVLCGEGVPCARLWHVGAGKQI